MASGAYESYPNQYCSINYGHTHAQYSLTANQQAQARYHQTQCQQYPQRQYSAHSEPGRNAIPISQKANGRSQDAPPASWWLCLQQPCANAEVKFARKADLQRHTQVTHNRAQLQLVACEYPGCHRRGDYGFTRRDKMIDHMRDVHKVDIPKRRNSKDPSTSPASSDSS